MILPVEANGLIEILHRTTLFLLSQQTLDASPSTASPIRNRLIDISHRRSETVDADDASRHVLEDTGVLGGDLTPKTVADQDRPTPLELLHDRVQICEMVGNRVDARLVAVAVPAQVVAQHMKIGGERPRQPIEAEGEVLDAVQQNHRSPFRVAVVVHPKRRLATLDVE